MFVLFANESLAFLCLFSIHCFCLLIVHIKSSSIQQQKSIIDRIPVLFFHPLKAPRETNIISVIQNENELWNPFMKVQNNNTQMQYQQFSLPQQSL